MLRTLSLPGTLTKNQLLGIGFTALSNQEPTYGPESPDLIWQGVMTTVTVTLTECGKHYFVVTAFDACDQESGPSNEIDHVVKPHSPKNLRK